jgi:hypothetical protein
VNYTISVQLVGSEPKAWLSALKKEVGIFAEYSGLYGFIAKSGYEALFPDINQGKEVFFQGSRQMDNFSRRYYERELGAGIGPSPSMKEHFGYTEPFRRFVQREDFTPQARPGLLVLPAPKNSARGRAQRRPPHSLLPAHTATSMIEGTSVISELQAGSRLTTVVS